MNDRWVANYPDAPAEFVRFSLRFFRAIYARAYAWRLSGPDAGTDAQRRALTRIIREVQAKKDIEWRQRPKVFLELLFQDLQATLWHPVGPRHADVDLQHPRGSGTWPSHT
jgi:hypothetical protein